MISRTLVKHLYGWFAYVRMVVYVNKRNHELKIMKNVMFSVLENSLLTLNLYCVFLLRDSNLQFSSKPL